MKKIFAAAILTVLTAVAGGQQIGETSITKWPDGKHGAISITFDDGSLNQFRIAVPIMDRLGLPGTFYITTGSLPGSTFTGKHIGRLWQEIAAEAKTIPTSTENVFERASAMRYIPVRGANSTFTRAGIQIDAGRMDEGIKIVDEFYKSLNAGSLSPTTEIEINDSEVQPGALTWDLARELTARGHEFSSHMVTHPYMSALDSPNIMYELEASRAEIRDQLGVRSTLVGEMPYDTEVKRAFELMLPVFPVARSRPWFRHTMELYHPGDASLAASEREYVLSRNTVYTRTTLEELNGWVDNAAAHDNVWLVTVHHGINGIGWEAMTEEDMEAHFRHIVASKDKLWVATFGDAARYIKERMTARMTFRVCEKCGAIDVEVDHPLDKTLFDLPLTLKTYVDPAWEEVKVSQGAKTTAVSVQRDAEGTYVIYNAIPGGGAITFNK
jgi:peptidoglycan/xylan/chitin deacetylase (PgdA/CDA1 family)